MKEIKQPEMLCEGDTQIYADTIRQFLGKPFSPDMKHNMAAIDDCRKEFEKWAQENFVEIVGCSWEIQGEKICGTMYGQMLRPELAYKGQYPVFEHERV